MKSTSVRETLTRGRGYMPEGHGGDKANKDKEVTLSVQRLESYQSKAERWQKQVREDERFRNGEQWSKEARRELDRRKSAPTVVNLIGPSVDQLKAMLTANNPRMMGVPREGSDRKTATLFSNIFEWIWQYNDGNQILRQAVDDYSARSMGYLMAWWDPSEDFGKGEVMMTSPNPLNVYVDPASQDRLFRDAAAIIVAETYSEEAIVRMYDVSPKWLQGATATEPDEGFESQGSDEDVQIDPESDRDSTYFRVIDEYSMRKRTYTYYQYQEFIKVCHEKNREEFLNSPAARVTTHQMEDGQSSIEYTFEADELAQLFSLVEKVGTIFHTIMVPDEQTGEMVPDIKPGPAIGEDAVSQTTVEQWSVGQMVGEGIFQTHEYEAEEVFRVLSIGERLRWKGFTEMSVYPIVGIPNRHNRNPYPISDVRMCRSLQMELNKTRSLILQHAANTAGITAAVPRGGTSKEKIKEELEKTGVRVIEYDPMNGAGPVFMYPPQLPGHLYQAEERIQQNIYEIFGIYPQMGSGVGHGTSSGLLILDEFSQRRIASKRSDIEASLNQFGKAIVQLVQLYYTEAKLIRIVEPSGRFNEVNLNSPVYDKFDGRLLHRINDVTIGKYDLIMASGSTLPSNRITKLEYYIQLFEKGIIDQIEVLKNIDEVDSEGVLERMGIMQQMQQQLGEMEQMIKGLEGDLQTADREAVSARKGREVERFKAQLAQMRGSLEVALNREKDREAMNFRENLSKDTAKTGAGPVAPMLLDQGLVDEISNLN